MHRVFRLPWPASDGADALCITHRKQLERILIIDCDVHQGNGNAVLFADEPRVTTFSMQCEVRSFRCPPSRKGANPFASHAVCATRQQHAPEALEAHRR